MVIDLPNTTFCPTLPRNDLKYFFLTTKHRASGSEPITLVKTSYLSNASRLGEPITTAWYFWSADFLVSVRAA